MSLKTSISIALLLLLNATFAWGQKVELQGVVQDSLGHPIANTNIIANPLKEGHQPTFFITDQKGRYKLFLDKDIPYALQIMQLGYLMLHDTLSLSANGHKNYTLYEGNVVLEPVTVTDMAIVVKGDTITYKTDRFKTGDERKLREILKKLPGVEVDRKGNVTVNGKKVTKLIIDGKDFFGGDVQLGVNNIPADAVKQVEVINDYHKVAFMKGLSHSDKIAMNIKLKKGKNHFIFGETEVGGGFKNRYNLHPTLFYYSPKTTLNLIGSFNNVNRSPLDFHDIMRFRGSLGGFLADPIPSGDAGLYKFSTSPTIRFRQTAFGALNFVQELNPKLQFSAYTIAAKQKTNSLSTNDIIYLTRQNLHEARKHKDEKHDFSSYSKVKLRYRPEPKTDMAYNLLVHIGDSRSLENISSKIGDTLHYTQTKSDPDQISVKNYFRYNRQPSYEHTTEIKANYIFKKSRNTTGWLFDRPVFPDFIPAETEGTGTYNFFHHYVETTHKLAAKYKHYWVIDNLNHLYPLAGIFYSHQKYYSTDYQHLANGTENSFKTAGFNNAIRFQFIDPYIGFQYKFMLGKFVFKPGLIYHHYLWKADQFGNSLINKEKDAFLPEFYGKYSISSTEKIELKYHRRSVFQDITAYADRLRLVRFNQLFRGNKNLENDLSDNINLRYQQFNIFSGMNYFVNLTYSHIEKQTQSSTVLEGVNQVSTFVYTDFPEDSYGISGMLTKDWRRCKIAVNGNFRLNHYSSLVDHQKKDYTSQYYGYGIRANTKFDDLPNLELGAAQQFSTSKSNEFTHRFTTFSPYANLRYAFLNGFILKLDYKYTAYQNISNHKTTHFQIGSASLYYRKTGSPWGFEIRADNIFDLRYKNSNSIDDFMIHEYRTYLQPRTVLFILSYQL